jgi:hypothetical protein
MTEEGRFDFIQLLLCSKATSIDENVHLQRERIGEGARAMCVSTQQRDFLYRQVGEAIWLKSRSSRSDRRSSSDTSVDLLENPGGRELEFCAVTSPGMKQILRIDTRVICATLGQSSVGVNKKNTGLYPLSQAMNSIPEKVAKYVSASSRRGKWRVTTNQVGYVTFAAGRAFTAIRF